MKKFRGVLISPLTAITFILCLFLAYGVARGQEESPDLELDEYRIIGKDTRVFVITGDRVSTVDFFAESLLLPEEERGIETSQGLIENRDRLFRAESFELTKGPYARADIFAGSRTANNLWGKVSLDMGKAAGTMNVLSRQAKENTRTNLAPSMREIAASGYYGVSGTRFSFDMGFDGEDDKLFGERFRDRERKASRYRGGLTMRTSPWETWDVTGRLNFYGGSYRDSEISCDDNESNISGTFSLVGDLYDIMFVSDTSADFMKFGGESGSLVSTGLKGIMLLRDNLGFQAGAKIFITDFDKNTDVKFYPEASLDWAVSRSSYVKVSYKPEVLSYSHSELYALNGLVLPVPMLFEDRKIAARGEFGWRFKPGSLVSVSVFHESSENSLVFNRSGNLFDIARNADVDITGFIFRTLYDKDGLWGFDGSIIYNDAALNDNGDVPYIPAVESVIQGYMVPRRKWKIRGALNFTGEHYVETGSGNTVDAFVTVDMGVERDIRNHFNIYCDLKNITNSEGAWWTDRYQIPGIGFYAGVKARY